MNLSTPASGRMPAHREAGAVLIISLILLVILTLFAIAAMNFTNVQTRIAGNLQYRSELKAVNQQAIETVISVNFTASTGASTITYDLNGDGHDDYTVTVTHTCMSSITLRPDDLQDLLTNPALYSQCTFGNTSPSPGIASANPQNASLCANALWDVAATGKDVTGATLATGASVVTHQGVSLLVQVGSGC